MPLVLGVDWNLQPLSEAERELTTARAAASGWSYADVIRRDLAELAARLHVEEGTEDDTSPAAAAVAEDEDDGPRRKGRR